ncbi:beta carbonic anhydrase 1-like [Ptychodera flava]|uniref:beta carbonic anhydrase 1-like n=1 Tax=Ptychodera flava TaxID=63121 RepID=UPI003969BC65
MDKVLKGVLRYGRGVKQYLVPQFKRVRDSPEPTAIMFTCMDSRLLPTRFTQTNVGDMFIVQNSGNLIPHSSLFGSEGLNTESAALELACIINGIRHVVVCGHSDCKAMNTLYSLKDNPYVDRGKHPFRAWLRRFGHTSLAKFEAIEKGYKGPLKFQGQTAKHNFEAFIDPEDNFNLHDKLSQVNCLQQIQNISSYGFLKKHLEDDMVHLHAMWFDVYSGNVFLFSREQKRFVEISTVSFEDLSLECSHLHQQTEDEPVKKVVC